MEPPSIITLSKYHHQPTLPPQLPGVMFVTVESASYKESSALDVMAVGSAEVRFDDLMIELNCPLSLFAVDRLAMKKVNRSSIDCDCGCECEEEEGLISEVTHALSGLLRDQGREGGGQDAGGRGERPHVSWFVWFVLCLCVLIEWLTTDCACFVGLLAPPSHPFRIFTSVCFACHQHTHPPAGTRSMARRWRRW